MGQQGVSMNDIAVVGNDIAALLVSKLLTCQLGNRVVLHSDGMNAARSVIVRPEIVKRGERVCSLLESLGLMFSEYKTKTGILLRGEVERFPEHFSGRRERALQVNGKLCSKSRIVDMPSGKRIPNFASEIPKNIVSFAWCDLVKALERGTYEVDSSKVVSVAPGVVATEFSRRRFDLVIVTLPLWRLAKCVAWDMPHSAAVIENTVTIRLNTCRRSECDPFSKFDVVWTPYTPEDLVWRVEQDGTEYRARFSGLWRGEETNLRLMSDLNFLFHSGWSVQSVDRKIPGYRFPLACQPIWPEGIVPIGKYSVWGKKFEGVESILSDFTETVERFGL